MKTTVHLKQTAAHGYVIDRESGRNIMETRPCIIVIGGIEWEAHPSEDTESCQQLHHINEIARRLCEEISKT